MTNVRITTQNCSQAKAWMGRISNRDTVIAHESVAYWEKIKKQPYPYSTSAARARAA